MARTKQSGLEAEFKHGTSIGPDGEILYDCPIEIHDNAEASASTVSSLDITPDDLVVSDNVNVVWWLK